MAPRIPELFAERMEALLGSEYEAFLASYDEPRAYGLRVNLLKTQPLLLANRMPLHLEPIPWCPSGFYYEEGERPAKHPYYQAGLYYIQEPSAMAPVELLDVRPGHRVLDVCAAPGGKSAHIAGKLQHEGLLVSNDISAERVKPLVKNIEIAGIRNAVVTNAAPDKLAESFGAFFDRILIDAPCSGEGMFRKDDNMSKGWDCHSIARYSVMQKDILRQVAALLKPGGRIVYSTCTFAPEENEAQIAAFLNEYPNFQLVAVSGPGLSPGRPEWCGAPDELAGTVRLWPHKVKGEGHFAAVLERLPETALPASVEVTEAARQSLRAKIPQPKAVAGKQELALVSTFLDEHGFTLPPAYELILRGTHAYASPPNLPAFHGITVTRAGLYLGIVKSLHRFEPSQALAMAALPHEAARRVELSLEGEHSETFRYLKGETLSMEESRVLVKQGHKTKGFTLVCIEGYPLGWGRYDGTVLKNDYPPGWRWLS